MGRFVVGAAFQNESICAVGFRGARDSFEQGGADSAAANVRRHAEILDNPISFRPVVADIRDNDAAERSVMRRGARNSYRRPIE